MDALSAVDRARWPSIGAPLAFRLARAAATIVFALVAFAPLVLCARRISGALTEPLWAVVLIAVAVLLAFAAIAWRRAGESLFVGWNAVPRYALWCAASIVVALWAIGLLLPGTSTIGVAGFLGVLLVEEGWSWGRLRQPVLLRARPSAVPAASATAPARETPPLGVAIDVVDDELERDVCQRMVRRRDAEGHELIEGTVHAEFLPAQRHAAAHVAICPPFAREPECFAEQCDGPAAQVKIAQVLPYGVRFDIKLDQPASETCDVTIEFSIQERPDS